MSKKGVAVVFLVFVFIFSQFSVQASESQCPTFTHYVNPGFNYKGIIKFGGLDLDPGKGGVQDTLTVVPGAKVTAQARWTFGTACPGCRIYVNAFGSWEPEAEIAKLYSGTIGSRESGDLTPFFFSAPEKEGDYIVRAIFVLGDNYARDFHGLNQQGGTCRGERHVFFMDGSLRVSGEHLGVEIHSPKPEAGIVQRNLGDTVLVNATVYGDVSSVVVFIDGKNVSKELPYQWETVNESLGVHVIAVEAIGNKTRKREEVRVELFNLSSTGDIPPFLWIKEFTGNLGDTGLSSNGQFMILTVNDDIRLYSQKGKLEWGKSYKGIRKVSISRDGNALAAAFEKSLFYLSPSGDILWNITVPEKIGDIALTPFGKAIVASGKRILYLHSDGSSLWNISLDENINAASVSDEENLALASKNRIYLLSNESILLWSYPAPGEVKAISSIQDGTVVAGAGKDILYVSKGILRQSIPVQDPIVDVAVSVDGNSILVGSEKAVRFYQNGTLLWHKDTKGPVRKVLMSEDASILLYAEDNRVALLVNEYKKRGSPAVTNTEGLVVIGALALVALLAFVLRSRRKKQEKTAPAKTPVIERKEAQIELEHVSEGLKMLREGSLLIQVVNSKTKKPVINATVHLNGRSKDTDEDGRVVFEDVARGRYSLRVERKFYRDINTEHVFRGPEEQVRLEMTPLVGIREEDEVRLKAAVGEVKRGYTSVSHLDTCLPSYFKSLAESVVDFVEASSDLSSGSKYFDYNDILESLVTTAETVCQDLTEILLDWRNVKLYEVGGKPGEECTTKFGDRGKIEKAVSNPPQYVEASIPIIRRRLSLIDDEITDKIGKLTITPLSGMWKMADDLVRKAEEEYGRGGAVEKLRAAVKLVFADAILDCVEDMMRRKDILDRLSHGIL